MAKFPSQRKLLYETGNISDDSAYSVLSSGGTAGHLNLPKDLSILNRRGYASTTRKGVPLVYQCKIDFYMHSFAGAGLESAVLPADTQTILKIKGVQNNWAIKNAAVKWHAAREKQFQKSGLKKGHRGAYAHEIRYNFDGASDTWLVPIDGDGAAFTGGTWDMTEIVTVDDASFQLKLVGTAVTEDSDVDTTSQTLGYSYLASRANLREDTNDEVEAIGDRSILGDMLADAAMPVATREVMSENIEDEQDQLPYMAFIPGNVNHDITEPVELGRAIAGFGNAYGSVIVDIPFGIADMTAKMTQSADTANINGLICLEVLDIFEMQG